VSAHTVKINSIIAHLSSSPPRECGILIRRPQRWEWIGVVGAHVTMGPKSSYSLSPRRLAWSVAAALGKTYKVSQCRDEFA
jgi:hypothetical protein